MRSLQFHPTRQVLMCAGEDGRLSLFEVGLPGTEDAFLQDVRFKAFPISRASFTADGSRIIVGSRKKVPRCIIFLVFMQKLIFLTFPLPPSTMATFILLVLFQF
ncbi:unnamed protein product [Gongylonema pulchrum]|uniref:WD_REPEATS_REGION domain-containing protein n=1 Tax=Gongylonema pulchrum TaxID=637853 RepID=A0A183DLG8_9BILA|nr:unnamed protein product [Gongylonema pulchrum]